MSSVADQTPSVQQSAGLTAFASEGYICIFYDPQRDLHTYYFKYLRILRLDGTLGVPFLRLIVMYESNQWG